MDPKILSAIKEIANTAGNDFQHLYIRIECPLEGGIKVLCWKETKQGKEYLPITNGVKPFYLLVQKMKQENHIKFNIVEIETNKNFQCTTKTIWDEQLQKQAEQLVQEGEK